MKLKKSFGSHVGCYLGAGIVILNLPGIVMLPAYGQAVEIPKEFLQDQGKAQQAQTDSNQKDQSQPGQSQSNSAQKSPVSGSVQGQSTSGNNQAQTNLPQTVQGKVVRSLVSLGQIQHVSDTLTGQINDLTKFLEDKMIDISYPVLLPAISTYPVTLATPKFAIYSGHYAEQRTKYVVTAIQNIGNLLEVINGDVQSLDIPQDKAKDLEPLVADTENTMKAVMNDYNLIAAQIGSNKAFDAEMTAAKLVDIRKFIATIDSDLKTIFRIINLKDATPETVQVITQLRLFGRDAHWLGVIAQYLHDNATELDPLDAFVSDAQVQGWLVMGPTSKDYARIEHSPYIDMKMNDVKKRMDQLDEYIKAVQNNMQQLQVPAQKVPAAEQAMNDLSGLVSDVNNRYQTLKQAVATGDLIGQRKTIAEQAQAISKDMQQASNAENKLAEKMLGSNSVL